MILDLAYETQGDSHVCPFRIEPEMKLEFEKV